MHELRGLGPLHPHRRDLRGPERGPRGRHRGLQRGAHLRGHRQARGDDAGAGGADQLPRDEQRGPLGRRQLPALGGLAHRLPALPADPARHRAADPQGRGGRGADPAARVVTQPAAGRPRRRDGRHRDHRAGARPRLGRRLPGARQSPRGPRDGRARDRERRRAPQLHLPPGAHRGADGDASRAARRGDAQDGAARPRQPAPLDLRAPRRARLLQLRLDHLRPRGRTDGGRGRPALRARLRDVPGAIASRRSRSASPRPGA